MCFAESHTAVATACAVEREGVELRRVLEVVAARPDDWQPLLDLLVCLHRLSPEALRAHLAGRAPASEAEALRDSLRRLAAEEERMPSADRRRRLQRVGGELLTLLRA